jgi:hypothetical protein
MGKWDVQTNTPEVVVKVASDGVHAGTTPVASEFVIQDKSPGGEHVHLGFDQFGNQLFENRR